MANFGYISVAPELAAIAGQITTVDAVVDANAVILVDIHDTDLPAVEVIANALGVILTDIHDVDLPAVGAIATANEVILTDIHDTDLPAVLAAIGDVVNRGSFEVDAYNAAPGDLNYHDVLNYSGAGKLICIAANMQATDGTIRVTIDSEGPCTVGITTGATYCLKSNDSFSALAMEPGAAGEYEAIAYEFNTSILIESKQSNGANPMKCGVFWQKD